jgi:hypothetical protein
MKVGIFIMSDSQQQPQKQKSLLKGEVKLGGAPVGIHPALFVDAQHVTPNAQAIAEKWKPSMKLVWQLKGTETQTSRICPVDPTPGNITGTLINGLMDRVLASGEAYDLGECVGRTYKVTVEKSKSGNGTRVTNCTLVS